MKEGQKFLEDLKNDKDMEKELLDFIKEKNQNGASSEEEKLEAVAEFAKNKGYEVFEEDIALGKARIKAMQNDGELDMVVGGATEKEMQEACFADYLCSWTWNNCLASNECDSGTWNCSSSVSQGDCNNSMGAGTGCEGVFWDVTPIAACVA